MKKPVVYFPNTAIFLTSSIEEGILLLPNPLSRTLLLSCLGLAQYHHPVKVCHYFVSGTHIHFIFYVENSEDISGFLERFKTESAHRINGLLGRKKRTVWCAGSDSPTVLDPETVIEKIAYTYANAAQDNLEESIDKYPGLSSWQAFKGNFLEQRIRCPYITRPATPFIGTRSLPLEESQFLADELCKNAKETHQFMLTPQAWLKAFDIPSSKYSAIRNSILEEVSRKEKTAAMLREQEQKSVIGREKLLTMPLRTDYQPERTGKRMLCLSSCKELRKKFIAYIKELKSKAKEVITRWKTGDFTVPFPLGLFPPAPPKLGESTLFVTTHAMN